MKLKTLCGIVLTVLLAAHSVSAQVVVVQRNVNLRPDASSQHEPIRLVLPGTILALLSETATSGYYHVLDKDGTEGWVWSRNVRVDLNAHLDVPAEPPIVPFDGTLETCPAWGTADEGTPYAVLNEAKRHVPTGGPPLLLSFEDFSTLQAEADSLVGQGRGTHLSEADRAKLHDLPLGDTGRKAGESTLVELEGFIVGTPHPNTGESVNCNLKGTANNDFHITIAPSASGTEFEGVVAEMIPQARPASWTISMLKAARNAGHKVLVVGGLLYDNVHRVNADPDHVKNGDPKRFSLWEVHPITQFYICEAPANACDVKTLGEWKRVQ